MPKVLKIIKTISEVFIGIFIYGIISLFIFPIFRPFAAPFITGGSLLMWPIFFIIDPLMFIISPSITFLGSQFIDRDSKIANGPEISIILFNLFGILIYIIIFKLVYIIIKKLTNKDV